MSDAISHRTLSLPNGLNVVLSSAPRLKRCAAALRVAAGSHDVSPRWPGLAHFLEHLFFLGTERFAADENLMAFVQRHGGQVNASTRERTTDFFFELPPAAFADGLERLCEMLTRPRMTMTDQLREREVLHAEFIAWSRDDAARDLLRRLQPLSASHPLRGFHAGNRFSLPVRRQTFQQALQDFYQRFYQAGQMTLSLAGPQSLDELEVLATSCGAYFPQGRRVEQQRPPALLADSARPLSDTDPRRMHLLLPCEGLPSGHERGAAFLCTWMNNAQPGGLVAQLRGLALIESLKANVLYEFAGQALIDIEVVWPASGSAGAANILALILDWLEFFKSNHRQLLDEYVLLERRGLGVSGALSLARHFCSEPDEAELSVQAVDALLGQLTPQRLLQAGGERPQLDISNINWRLPEPNPFLRPSAPAITQTRPLPALTFSNTLPVTGEAALYLRWTLSSPQPTLARMLGEGLEPLIADARQAGVSLNFSSCGSYWQLKLAGLAEPLPAVLEQAIHLLAQPGASMRARYGSPYSEPAAIPIRQLLRTLPDHFLNNAVIGETDDLQAVWAQAHWSGFATGFEGSAKTLIGQAARLIPGTPERFPSKTLGASCARWQIEPSESSETAILMFYPAPSKGLADEAMWRLFAHLMQAPFYQRLRIELQLGYAVFSGFRQIAGQGGLLFGVQSPSATTQQLVAHIETFIRSLPTLIESADLARQANALRSQLDPAFLESQHAAELLWQAHLAGHRSDYSTQLQHSLAHLPHASVLNAAYRLAQPDSIRLCLSNRSSPPRPRATEG